MCRAFTLTAALTFAFMSAALSGCAADGPGSSGHAEAMEQTTVLDGREKTILVNGYSTSYAWPAMLQDMLDAHSGGERIYHVKNSVIGGAPVETWIAEPGTRNHERTVVAMERDFTGEDPELLGDVPKPTVAICQQSLQLTGDRRGPVKSEHDMAGAELGADAMEELALLLREHGIEDVYIATHIYKKPVEPEVGNERIALRRLLSRGHGFIHAGPDVWETTRETFPESFEDDELHPNEMGMKIMAEGWYRTLAGESAEEGVVERMWARDYDVDTMMRRYLAWRRGESETPR